MIKLLLLGFAIICITLADDGNNVIQNYTKYYSEIGLRRKEVVLFKLINEYTQDPNAIVFSSGAPNPDLFPFKRIKVGIKDGYRYRYKIVGEELTAALQYGATKGYQPLVDKWRKYQEKWHSPQYKNWDIHFTVGSQDGLNKIFELLVNENQPFMHQTPIYSGLLEALKPMNLDFIPINIDEDGIIPEEIEKVFEERIRLGKELPKLLSTNPVGSNPTGVVFTNERKAEIYKLAQKYDFLIIEDDPYYFIHFLDKRPKSFFSMDTDGRVIRLDSFSKIMSAGIRLGVMTAPKPIIEKIQFHTSTSVIHTSGLSQVLVQKLLDEWSYTHLMKHFEKIRKFYKEKKDLMIDSLNKHFSDLAEWKEPKGGLFVWVKVTAVDNISDLAMNKINPKGYYVLPGTVFELDETKLRQYIRLSYSQLTKEKMEEGLYQISKIIRENVNNTNNS